MTVKNLKDSLGKIGSKYELAPLTFPQLDVEKLKKKLCLKTEAEQRGKKEMPAQSANVFDDVEQRIVSLVDAEVKSATESYHDDMSTFNSRIGRLSAAGHSTNIIAVAAAAEGDFEMVVRRDAGNLYIAKNAVGERYENLKEFKKQNNLKSAARYPNSRLLAYAIAGVILLLETGANGFFFAKGNEMGLLGGGLMALAFSFLNIAIAFWLGNYACRYAIHLHKGKRAVGYFLCAVLPLATISLNLLVAHYRTVMVHAIDQDVLDVTKEAFLSFASSPLGLQDVESWFLFFVGCTFAIIATIDFWKMDDPYPSYGHVSRDHDEKMHDYAFLTEHSLNEISDMRDDKMDEINEYNNALNAKLNEAKAILESQKRWQVLFVGHLTHLEDSGRQLLAFYRNFNISERKTPAPKHFSEQWTLERPALSEGGGDLAHVIEAFQKEAEDMKLSYESCINRVNAAYTSAVREYKTIDQLKPEQLKQWQEETSVETKGLSVAA